MGCDTRTLVKQTNVDIESTKRKVHVTRARRESIGGAKGTIHPSELHTVHDCDTLCDARRPSCITRHTSRSNQAL